MPKRLGITMRVTHNPTYSEERDTLSRDWLDYFSQVFPYTVLVPLLNNGERIVYDVEALGLEGMVFSNGNDVGESARRDETEKALLELCVRSGLPVFGVCRGLQILNVLFGGGLVKDIAGISGKSHVAVIHKVKIHDLFKKLAGNDEIEVNSYHSQGVLLENLAEDLRPFALDGDVVEGFYHDQYPVFAVQWHPERKNPSSDFDRQLIHGIFGRNLDFKSSENVW